jgi:hypothetical protein
MHLHVFHIIHRQHFFCFSWSWFSSDSSHKLYLSLIFMFCLCREQILSRLFIGLHEVLNCDDNGDKKNCKKKQYVDFSDICTHFLLLKCLKIGIKSKSKTRHFPPAKHDSEIMPYDNAMLKCIIWNRFHMSINSKQGVLYYINRQHGVTQLYKT